MKLYSITLKVDQGWLDTLNDITDVQIMEDEYLEWVNVEEIK